MPNDSSDLDEILGLNLPDPASLVCHEAEDGKGFECEVIFAYRHVCKVTAHAPWGKPMRRESDREIVREATWKKFWRYIGAA